MNTLRLGIVGTGFGQQVHLPAFRSHPQVTVQAVCASSQPRAAVVAAKLGIAHAYGDWRQLCADAAIDAVSISVPAPLQPLIAIAAIDAGKHVFLEKPVAMDADAAERLLAAAERAGVVHAVDFEFPEIPAWQAARQALHAGAVGRLRAATVTWHLEAQAFRQLQVEPSAPAGWKARAPAGGGALNLFVSHTVQCIQWLLGPVTRVAGRLHPGTDSEARVLAWLELADGALVTVDVAADAPMGTGHRWEICGDDGTMVLENTTSDYIHGFQLKLGSRTRGSLSPVTIAGEWPPTSDGRVQAVGALARRFADAALAGDPRAMHPTLQDGLHAQRLLDRIRLAHADGRWHEVNPARPLIPQAH